MRKIDLRDAYCSVPHTKEYYARDTRCMRLCNISATAPRICDKFQEVCFRSSGKRVFGYDCEIKVNNIVFT